MAVKVDARGFTCPMPVAMVQKEVKKNAPDALVVLVDDRCAVGNVTRFGRSMGYKVAIEQQDETFCLTLEKA